MTNPHIDNAVDWTDAGDAQPSSYALANAQIEATLAVAYELRTTNFIAAYGHGQWDGAAEVLEQIKERLLK